MPLWSYLFIAGGVVFIGQLLVGITIFILMTADVVAMDSPPRFLWLSMLLAIWLMAAGGAWAGVSWLMT
jgi:hypothetical protein